MKKWLLLMVLALSSAGLAQTSFYTDRAVGTFPVGSGSAKTTALIPIQFGQVRVCTSADIGGVISPCPDIASITDIIGNPLSVVGGNFGQLKTDVVGRFSFGCTSGTNYLVQVAASSSNVPQLSYPITCSFGTLPGGNLVVTNPAGSALQTINGPLSLAGFGLTANSATITTSVSAATVTTTAGVTVGTTITNYNGVATVSNGVPVLVAKADATAQQASIGVTLLYTIPASGAGTYIGCGYTVVTQAATTSSTLPIVQFAFTDNDTSVSTSTAMVSVATTGNTVGSTSSAGNTNGQNAGCIMFQAKASTTISYQASGYASVGATPMQYAAHIKLMYLGN